MSTQIPFSEMTHDQRQIFCDFIYKEMFRHLDDIVAIKKDLADAKEIYGIEPRTVYVDKRIEVVRKT